jgi:hypothetical protein
MKYDWNTIYGVKKKAELLTLPSCYLIISHFIQLKPSRVGQFWTPIPAKGGSLLHADSQALTREAASVVPLVCTFLYERDISGLARISNQSDYRPRQLP